MAQQTPRMEIFLEVGQKKVFAGALAWPGWCRSARDEAERERSESILAAIWRGFDRAVEAAAGHQLRKGPRGGGRDRDAIVRHVLGDDAGYLRSFGQAFRPDEDVPLSDELKRTRAAIKAALRAGARGEIPKQGPCGGKIWTPRYFVRRHAWHTVDHLWEIEDRIM